MFFKCLSCCCVGTSCHCALSMWWTVRCPRVIQGTSLGQAVLRLCGLFWTVSRVIALTFFILCPAE